MNVYSGSWTDQKNKLITEYIKAYLEKNKSRRYWKMLYFDGFSGSRKKGKKTTDKGIDSGEDIAEMIMAIKTPYPFDRYYFIDRRKKFVDKLRNTIEAKLRQFAFISSVETGDCNQILKDIAEFLQQSGPDRKVLAFIDPCGMQLKWESIECLKGLNIDMWILVPLGIGVNRLLRKDGNISDSWMKKLQEFLGLSTTDIKNTFYEDQPVLPLFGKETEEVKKDKAIDIAGKLYHKRLKNVFKYVSNPFLLENKKHNIMYHFLFGSNNRTAVKIANDLIKN